MLAGEGFTRGFDDATGLCGACDYIHLLRRRLCRIMDGTGFLLQIFWS
jgi:hypothetical protein